MRGRGVIGEGYVKTRYPPRRMTQRSTTATSWFGSGVSRASLSRALLVSAVRDFTQPRRQRPGPVLKITRPKADDSNRVIGLPCRRCPIDFAMEDFSREIHLGIGSARSSANNRGALLRVIDADPATRGFGLAMIDDGRLRRIRPQGNSGATVMVELRARWSGQRPPFRRCSARPPQPPSRLPLAPPRRHRSGRPVRATHRRHRPANG